jgi:hypothetical protein
LKKSKDNNLALRLTNIEEQAKKRSPKTLMIAKVAHADDKNAVETKIIGLYVPTRF